MVDPHEMPDMAERLARIQRQQIANAGGGNGPTDGGDDMERRVSILEKNFETMNGKLDKILEGLGDFRVSSEQRSGSHSERLASIEGKLDSKASAVEVATLSATTKSLATAEALGIVKGRVDSLPSTWQMITLVIGIVGTILGGAFLILKFGLTHTP